MTTKLIFGSLLALTMTINAQEWTTIGAGPDIYKTSPSGYTGIGTTSPTQKLDVRGGPIQVVNNGYTYIGRDVTPGSDFYFYHKITTNYQLLGSSKNVSGSFKKLGFAIGANDDEVDVKMTIVPNGNVGIGNINPSNGKLEITADGDATHNRGLYSTALRTNGAASLNTGIEGLGGSATECVTGTSYGVVGIALNSTANYGGYFTATNSFCGNSYSYGLFASGHYRAAYFSGNVEYTGTLTGPSDRKLKENISHLENVIDKIKLLKPSTYTYKVSEYKDMRLPEGKQMGLIAQELESVFPELVTYNEEMIHKNEKGEVITNIPGHKSVNYLSLIPVLIAGIQEQQATIQSQQIQLDEQRKLIDAFTQKSNSATGIGSLNPVETGFQMSQNEPNPFTHETVVKYTLPQTVANAFMAVYDLTGKQITTFPITEKGSSSLTMTSEKLAAGIYIYSIVADGKVIDSKRMIVAEK